MFVVYLAVMYRSGVNCCKEKGVGSSYEYDSEGAAAVKLDSMTDDDLIGVLQKVVCFPIQSMLFLYCLYVLLDVPFIYSFFPSSESEWSGCS